MQKFGEKTLTQCGDRVMNSLDHVSGAKQFAAQRA